MGHQYPGSAAVSEGDALAQLVAAEVQAWKVSRVGLIVESTIDRIGTGIDGALQRGRRASRTNEFHHLISSAKRDEPITLSRAACSTRRAGSPNGPNRAASSLTRSS